MRIMAKRGEKVSQAKRERGKEEDKRANAKKKRSEIVFVSYLRNPRSAHLTLEVHVGRRERHAAPQRAELLGHGDAVTRIVRIYVVGFRVGVCD